MTGYLLSFSIYTLAMIGIIFLALFIYKSFSTKCFSKKTSMLNIEDTMNLSPRKTLYVVNVEKEKFLIAADADRTTLIAKLGEGEKIEIKPIREDKSATLNSFDGVQSLAEFSSLVEFKKPQAKKQPMMRELAKKLTMV